MVNLREIGRRIEQLLGDVGRIQNQLEQHSRNEASALGNLSSSQQRLSSAAPAFRATNQRAVDRYNKGLLDIQRKKAELQGALARKSAELNKAQADHLRAQQHESRERVTNESRLRREQERREEALRREIADLRTSSDTGGGKTPETAEHDLFISHASEDKDEIVRPLAARLSALGVRVWFDETALSVGDSLRRSIDLGLSRSRFGVVVLSAAFFAKNWPQYELDGLVAKENAHGTKVILPIWHKVTKDEVLSFSPTLADRVALNTGVQSLDEISGELAKAVG